MKAIKVSPLLQIVMLVALVFTFARQAYSDGTVTAPPAAEQETREVITQIHFSFLLDGTPENAVIRNTFVTPSGKVVRHVDTLVSGPKLASMISAIFQANPKRKLTQWQIANSELSNVTP